jgi:hypothetical protein
MSSSHREKLRLAAKGPIRVAAAEFGFDISRMGLQAIGAVVFREERPIPLQRRWPVGKQGVTLQAGNSFERLNPRASPARVEGKCFTDSQKPRFAREPRSKGRAPKFGRAPVAEFIRGLGCWQFSPRLMRVSEASRLPARAIFSSL